MNKIQDAIQRFKQGQMLIVQDAPDRENEADVMIAAEKITPEVITFMARFCCGLLCLALTQEQCQKLNLPLQTRLNCDDPKSTAFLMSIDAREGVGSGISSADRCQTILTAIHPNAKPEDVSVPGHILPLQACSGGLKTRAGHTEAAIELAKLANLRPATVLCELIDEQGQILRGAALQAFSEKHQIPIISIAQLQAFIDE